MSIKQFTLEDTAIHKYDDYSDVMLSWIKYGVISIVCHSHLVQSKQHPFLYQLVMKTDESDSLQHSNGV